MPPPHGDLRGVLNDRQDDYGRTHIDCHQDRRQWAGQAADTREAMQATLRYDGGSLAFIPELRQVTWPHKFRTDIPVKYNESTNPTDFLQVYSVTIMAADGDVKIMTNWFPLALKPSARTLLMNLPEGSIKS
jgi:hypothetical protein